MSDIDPNALASALPAGIGYAISNSASWDAQEIAYFQAARLAESGYQLVYVGVHQPDTVAGALMKLSREGKIPEAHAETVAAALAHAVDTADDPAVKS